MQSNWFCHHHMPADSMEDKSMLTSMLIDRLINDNQLKKILTNTPTASTS
jgi:hypothetical protein